MLAYEIVSMAAAAAQVVLTGWTPPETPVGVALLAAGVSSVMTLWSSAFARFMYLEDLGMTQAAKLTRYTPVDRGLLVFGAILVLLGAAALIAAAWQTRDRGRAER